MPSLAALLANVPRDRFRDQLPFSADLNECQQTILAAGTEARVADAVLEWLSQYQPCLFGRLAAKNDQILICVLTATDLERGDQHVKDKIEEKRLEWTALGFRGKRSGFVVLCADPRLCVGEPGPELLEFSKRLAFLYLGTQVQTDEIALEQLFLEIPGAVNRAWRWDAGINFFAASADRRWWHDHRIPGGVAFSVNSVGHMAKSGLLARATADYFARLGEAAESSQKAGIDSLPKALELAMRTIAGAAETEWGKATELIPLSEHRSTLDLPPCPVGLSSSMRAFNHCCYRGYYHTDMTLPEDYFVPSPDRNPAQRSFELDFTYLYLDSPENPDFRRMGRGIRIRAEPLSPQNLTSKGRPSEIQVQSAQRLVAALQRYPTA